MRPHRRFQMFIAVLALGTADNIYKMDLKHSEEEYFQKANNLIHNSCPILRSIFRRRWEQTTGSPWSDVSSGKELVRGIGKDFYSYHGTAPIQRELMKNGNLEEWDMSLLGNLLLQIEWWTQDNESKEKQAIEKLMELRNEAAHNSIRKLNEEGYQKIEKVIRSQLKELGVSESEIDGIVEKAAVITVPVSGWPTAKRIMQKGNKKFQTGDYPRAIERYSDALEVPNLSGKEKATLLEKRARARLAFAENMKPFSTERKTCLEEVQVDIGKSLEYNSDSWKAHEIQGKVYKHKNNYSSACEYLDKALALSPPPAQTDELKAELDHCKFTLWKIEKMNPHDEINEPKTLEERIKDYRNSTGTPLTKEKWLKKMEDGSPYSHVQKGLQYAEGYDVKQDYVEASKHFAKADELGSVQGTVMLARLYLEGLGVKQSFPRAYELYNKAAMAGDVNAQHNLGQLYQEGIYVAKDLETAAIWFKKAALKGYGGSANNLAVMYFAGEGVPMDKEKAVMYWKLGMRKKIRHSAQALLADYLENMEPHIARIMLDRAVELGYDDHYELQQLYIGISEMEKWKANAEPQLVAFEKEHELKPDRMTFAERRLRYRRFKENETLETLQLLQESKPSKKYLEDPWRSITILDYRREFAKSKKRIPSAEDMISRHFAQLEIRPSFPGYLDRLKSIKMIEINEGKEAKYEGRVLNLTIIEDPMIGVYALTDVHTIAEDEDGDVIHLAVYNVPHTSEPAKLFGCGSRISVINPFLRHGRHQDQKTWIGIIRVDDPKCIIYNDGIKDMCRYCGEENASLKCSKCKRAKYCSKDCQEKDWSMFKHKLICF